MTGHRADRLVRVRHGSGSFVTVRTETLIAVSMASAIPLESAPVTDVMDILGVVNSHAAGLTARHATDEQIAALRTCAEGLADLDDLDRAMDGLRDFLRRLAEPCGNPVLAAICVSLGEVQVELARELSQRELLPLRKVAGALQQDRIAVVAALEARDPERAVRVTRAYPVHALDLLTSVPEAREVRCSDPSCTGLISSLMRTELASLTR
ncbi:FadR/GntR family transcriptional regulator [Streptomyces sp. MMS24-I2-30]|uniref:FadR/GntR family transcriptional regulator n=1 Tax=Streptomyces sp. MMS24-I2-30 TaxID=3351564 RepID=UPI003896838F